MKIEKTKLQIHGAIIDQMRMTLLHEFAIKFYRFKLNVWLLALFCARRWMIRHGMDQHCSHELVAQELRARLLNLWYSDTVNFSCKANRSCSSIEHSNAYRLFLVDLESTHYQSMMQVIESVKVLNNFINLEN